MFPLEVVTPTGVPYTLLGAASVGVPYSYGAGAPKDFQPGQFGPLLTGLVSPLKPGSTPGLDCSGDTQGFAVVAGWLHPSQPDRSANMLAFEALDAVTGDPQFGDVALYGQKGQVTHVGVYLWSGIIRSMSGGSSKIYGDTKSACGKLIPFGYRKDFLGFGRWKSEVAQPWKPNK